MSTYHKIDALYARDPVTKKLIPGVYRNPAVEFLKDNQWEFTEKIDGTNIRVMWDGYRVTFAGRTDKSVIPVPLLEVLERQFGGAANEEIFEDIFGTKEVVLYGEGYGGKIQNGTNYRKDVGFILFDVKIGSVFVDRDTVRFLAEQLNCEVVPCVLRGTIEEAVEYVKSHEFSTIGTAKMEGVVGRPVFELYDKRGERIIVKIKRRDFEEE